MFDAHDFAGGFIPSMSQESPSQQRTAPARSDIQSVMPLTVRQLRNAQHGMDEVFRVDGQPLAQVTFIGRIVAVDTSHPTNTNYKIDDGTGIIDVKRWSEADEAGSTQAAATQDILPLNMYVRVYGHLRLWQGSLNVVAFRLIKIDNHNEITFHLLDSIYTHLYHTKGPLPPEPHGTSAASGGLMGPPPPTPPRRTHAAAEFRSPGSGRFTPPQEAILQALLSAPNKDQGLHRDELLKSIVGFPEGILRNELDRLISDAHIYTTLDDDHFCTAVQL